MASLTPSPTTSFSTSVSVAKGLSPGRSSSKSPPVTSQLLSAMWAHRRKFARPPSWTKGSAALGWRPDSVFAETGFGTPTKAHATSVASMHAAASSLALRASCCPRIAQSIAVAHSGGRGIPLARAWLVWTCTSSVAKLLLALEAIHLNEAVHGLSVTASGKYQGESYTPNLNQILPRTTEVQVDLDKVGTRKRQSHQMPPFVAWR